MQKFATIWIKLPLLNKANCQTVQTWKSKQKFRTKTNITDTNRHINWYHYVITNIIYILFWNTTLNLSHMKPTILKFQYEIELYQKYQTIKRNRKIMNIYSTPWHHNRIIKCTDVLGKCNLKLYTQTMGHEHCIYFYFFHEFVQIIKYR